MSPSNSQPPPPPPDLPNYYRIQRLKLVWRLFLVGNLGLGAYMFARAKLKDLSMRSEKPHEKSPPPIITDAPTVDFLEEIEIAPSTPIAEHVKVNESVPEDRQRELFKWVLDEKRKVYPEDKDEKKQNDEEKAILKRF